MHRSMTYCNTTLNERQISNMQLLFLQLLNTALLRMLYKMAKLFSARGDNGNIVAAGNEFASIICKRFRAFILVCNN